MEIREILAANLKRLRKAKGLSQEELAHQVGIDRTYVSALERRVYAASIDLVERLAKALEVEPQTLHEPPAPNPKRRRRIRPLRALRACSASPSQPSTRVTERMRRPVGVRSMKTTRLIAWAIAR